MNETLDILKKSFKKLKEIEELDYTSHEGNLFETSIYLYCRYGEIPSVDKIKKISNIIKRYDSLFSEDLNDEIRFEIESEEDK